MEKIKFETVESTLWYILFLTERKTFLSEASVKKRKWESVLFSQYS